MAEKTREEKRAYDNAYYRANYEHRKAQIRRRNIVAIARNQANFLAYIKQQSCLDCGLKDWRILQLDHRTEKGIKRTDVSIMVHGAYSWEAIEIEIKKCEVRCPNCHTLRTGISRGYYRFAA